MNKQEIQKNSVLQRIKSNYGNIPNHCGYIKQAVDFLQQILRKDYGSTFISFNGGKDSTMVLTLTYLAVTSLQDSSPDNNTKSFYGSRFPKGLYFDEPNPFPEMVMFYQQMKHVFDLEIKTLGSKKYAEELLKLSKEFKFGGVIMGSRNDDPYCQHLDLVTQSDVSKGYPPFVRINPIIRWNYEQVWAAIRLLQIPYCVLYQQGYTSLGNMNNTVRNHTLACGQNKFKSPFEAKPQTERICRVNDKN